MYLQSTVKTADAMTTPTLLLATQVYVPALLPVTEETLRVPPAARGTGDPWNSHVMTGRGLPVAEQVKVAIL